MKYATVSAVRASKSESTLAEERCLFAKLLPLLPLTRILGRSCEGPSSMGSFESTTAGASWEQLDERQWGEPARLACLLLDLVAFWFKRIGCSNVEGAVQEPSEAGRCNQELCISRTRCCRPNSFPEICNARAAGLQPPAGPRKCTRDQGGPFVFCTCSAGRSDLGSSGRLEILVWIGSVRMI